MRFIVDQFVCGRDNIAALIHDEKHGKTLAIDAPDGEAIYQRLEQNRWCLDAILVTHHHSDHTVGLPLLKERTGAAIYASQGSRVTSIDHYLVDKQYLEIGDFAIIILATPGHTLDSISFYFPQDKMLFTGDTLFSLGCGRIFEGDAAMLLASLKKIRALSDDTKLYCGHEYTLANGRFALTIEPSNRVLIRKLRAIEALARKGKITLPSLLKDEKEANPFLRWDSLSIRANLGLVDARDEDVLAAIRRRKDKF